MNLLHLYRRLHDHPVLTWTSAMLLLVSAAFLLQSHAAIVSDVRATALPLLERVPELERRSWLLSEQAELSAVSAAERTGSPAEQVDVYALPAKPDLDKIVALFDSVREELMQAELISAMSRVRIGDTATVTGEGYEAYPVTFELSAHRRGLDTFMTIVRAAGLLTVGDALTADEQARLVAQTEQENPSAIVALEQYFATNLLSYLREPRPTDGQLLKSFSLSTFEAVLRDVVRSSLLGDGQRVFSGSLGERLAALRLWPLEFMTVERVDLRSGKAPDWYHVQMQLLLYTRGD